MYPAYPFRMSALDMARFGLLYLRNGNWRGRQIVPQDWVAGSTMAHSVEDPELNIGYGMMWYVIPEDFPVFGPFSLIHGSPFAQADSCWRAPSRFPRLRA